MSAALTMPPTQDSESVDHSASQSALTRCREVYEQTLASAKPGMRGLFDAKKDAVKLYKSALPPLHGAENIRDFIACVAQGVLLEAIDAKESTLLIHAARAAIFVHRNAAPAPSPKTTATQTPEA